MVSTLYIEKEIKDAPRTYHIKSKFKNARKIYIDRYTELFNKKNQHFRVQKTEPSMILANKYDNFILKTPKGFGIGCSKNYYFSHMYNCIYDCKYCFLQGLYSSANYVIFVNYEDFMDKIKKMILINKKKTITFFSGYDCDSLALEKITGFANYFLKNFHKSNNVFYEFRTKSLQIFPFLSNEVSDNFVIAYSLLPQKISNILDDKTPSINLRIKSMKKLCGKGWKIGLRFDPLIHYPNWKIEYKNLIDLIFENINIDYIHSISFGSLRFPIHIYKKIRLFYPGNKLLSQNLFKNKKIYSVNKEIEDEMTTYCINLIKLKTEMNLNYFTCSSY